MRFLLIPVADALPGVQAHLDAGPDDASLSAQELRELLEVTSRYVRASEALLRYAQAVSGKPCVS